MSPRLNRRRLLLAVVFIALGWILAWTAARELMVRRDLARADSIVVLAGSSTYRERARKAAQLLQADRAGAIILSDDHQQGGWSNRRQRNPFFVELSVEELRQYGVPREQIFTVSPREWGTYYEALAVREFAVRQNLKSILIVTSAYHSRRALWTFQRVFSETGIQVGLDPVETGQQTPRPGIWWLYPKGWEMVPGEYIKIVYYWLRY